MSRTILHAAILLAVTGLLAACTAGQRPAPARNAPPVSSRADFGVEIGALPAQELPPGSCGLFLWSKSADRRLVFFSNSHTPDAHMMLDGRSSHLTRIAADGDMRLHPVVRQRFDAGGRHVGLEFEVEPRRGLIDGMLVPRGTLRLKDDAGWEMMLPVGGLIACSAG